MNSVAKFFLLVSVILFIWAFFYYVVLINCPNDGVNNKMTTDMEKVFISE